MKIRRSQFIKALIALMALVTCAANTTTGEDNVDALIQCSQIIYQRNVEYMEATPVFKEFAPQEPTVEQIKKMIDAKIKTKYVDDLSKRFGISPGRIEPMLQRDLIDAVRAANREGKASPTSVVAIIRDEKFSDGPYAFTRLVLLDMSSYLQPESIKAVYQLKKRWPPQTFSLPFPLCAILGNCN